MAGNARNDKMLPLFCYSVASTVYVPTSPLYVHQIQYVVPVEPAADDDDDDSIRVSHISILFITKISLPYLFVVSWITLLDSETSSICVNVPFCQRKNRTPDWSGVARALRVNRFATRAPNFSRAILMTFRTGRS